LIEQRYLCGSKADEITNEPGRFYRLTRWQKIEHIAAYERAGFKPFVYRH